MTLCAVYSSIDRENIMILACPTTILSSVLIDYNAASKQKRRHTVWVHGYLKDRGKVGAYTCHMRDLRVKDYDILRNYLQVELMVIP